MRILVTGGTGFLGRHVVWRLNASGHEVVFTGRNARHAETVLNGITRADCETRFVMLEHGSAESPATMHETAAGADAAVHCAALSSPCGRPEAFHKANVESTREIVDACRARGVPRLVHISTPSLYFDFRDRIGIREDEPLPSPVNDYARTKGIAEQHVMQSTLDSVIALRPRAIIGPYDATLLPRLLRVARTSRLPLMRGGDALIDLTYVDNVVDAIELALSADLQHAIVNISNGEPMPVRTLFAMLADAFGIELRVRRIPYPIVDAVAALLERAAFLRPGWEPPVTRYSVGLLAYSQTLDLTRARNLLGYAPQVTLAEGIRRTAVWADQCKQARS
ncbi:Nucleoside-diphosphate-sugar epimerase [Candidatus Burkholderia verschuerenii]|uniref:Nucleoside-diphosphate-sugar epimerase n=1 Tax=Candidatus Burkholderia verschuerenii TaxID=242163 RepID=A0A0L0M4C9_9BURK|nr:NAD-dependent epimerase/dehydratase family protein [Candidatus Burkholderia verschuerenii]KND56859.1 Nucleoside-diphosphate-sugar epimerase [Candidatus Burkholderia verschuerenii]